MNDNTPIELLFEKAEVYGKTSIELLKLNAIDKTADVVSSLAVQMATFLVVALFTLVINIGLALWLGDLLGKIYYGFFVVAGFYAAAAIIIYFFGQQWIKVPLNNSIVARLLKKNQS
jgi:hypothetical protein